MSEIEIKIKKTVNKLMQLFVEEDYLKIAEWSKNTRLTAEEIKDAIDDYGYGRKVVTPPTDFLDKVDFLQVVTTNDECKQWSVVFQLWMEEVGESDLSVETTFTESAGEYFDIEIDGVHPR